ncbi:glycosyltransferase family 4 protein [Pseudochryseolinea flava]|uniref:Glycosyltransferase family 4 protein n=1 Tax=Pseudochryseolinea flava TaxID=2059302 RepID=A0A364XY63_9BACT|nr:glycosyltransferase family 4 protein [Pseudochryseolinea flava]RAV98742.1 glycosyltransferase family 4 protein [Pseudochryseolinea flava]
MKKLRIAQVAPLYESVPPKLYGGTERIVSFLTEALISMGHDVTLYASGDSLTDARLIPVIPAALRLDPNKVDQIAPHITMVQMVQNDRREYDIIHYHIDYLHFPVSHCSKKPHLTTLHGRLNIPELQALYNIYREVPVVSISNSQRIPLQQAHWTDTVYHGLPENLFKPVYTPGHYLAFLGRISPEKGLDDAIEIAKRVGIPLKIAAKIEGADQGYFQNVIEPLLDHPLIEFIGEVNESEKQSFIGNAIALLFPIKWPEPFGLVMIESLACATPVVAYASGSVPEILTSGVDSFIVNDLAGAVACIDNIKTIDRHSCRASFDRRFTAKQMAENYLKVYQEVIASKKESLIIKETDHEYN